MRGHLLTELVGLLQTPQPPGLDAGPRSHVAAARALAEQMDELARQHGLPTRPRELVEALVLLWHDHLHAAHLLVQDLPGADAALIHAILHRREPDYWNAKYWLERVGEHPVYPRLAAATPALAAKVNDTEDVARFCRGGTWRAVAFVDFVQACAVVDPNDPRRRLAVAVQETESRLLLEHLAGIAGNREGVSPPQSAGRGGEGGAPLAFREPRVPPTSGSAW